MASVTTDFLADQLVVTPLDVDLSRSPLAGQLGMETYVLGAFNPGLTRLPGGNLLMMIRVAEALKHPISDGHVHVIRWSEGQFVIDRWPLELADTADPRKFLMRGGGWKVMALTSLSWLLPVELSPDGLKVVAVHYDKAVAPEGDWQCYGVEDARISKVGDEWLMTTCSVSPERHSTTLYRSDNGLDWRFADIVLDHQNKDMLIFEGKIDGQYWAQTRPLGDLYFAYPPGSKWRAGPSINLATSPDGLHWKPFLKPGIRPHSDTVATARIGGGTPPILTDEGWFEPEPPAVEIATSANGSPIVPIQEGRMYVRDVVFTTGIVDAGDHYAVASGEADLACRITHVPKSKFR